MVINKIGRKTKEWLRARKRLIKEFAEKELASCEICGSTFGLSFHHRNKRRENDKHIFDKVILVCAKHHQELEYNRTLTKQWFEKLR